MKEANLSRILVASRKAPEFFYPLVPSVPNFIGNAEAFGISLPLFYTLLKDPYLFGPEQISTGPLVLHESFQPRQRLVPLPRHQAQVVLSLTQR